MTSARIFWVYASLALLPSSAFPLYRSPNVFSKARGTPRAQTQRTGYHSSPSSLYYSRLYCHSTKSAEPPPPYPPPQPFASLTSEAVKNQIGLLRGYFEHRLAGLDSLPDDPQNPAQAKLGPLGQVIRPSSAAIAAAAAGGSKKKAKPKDGAAAAAATGIISGPAATGAVTAGTSLAGVSVGVMSGVVAGVMQPATPVLSSVSLLSPLGVSVAPSAPSMVASTIPTGEAQPQVQTPKKKKATTGAGTGAVGGAGAGGGGGTGKKRGRPPEGLPPVVVASA